MIHGKEFKDLLKKLSGKAIQRYEKFPYPQIHHFKPQAEGLNIHTDFGTDRQFATLMYFNDEWTPGMGGELLLFKKSSNGLVKAKTVEPKPNSMFFFEVTPCSFHAVAPMTGNWQRDTIITDWQFA